MATGEGMDRNWRLMDLEAERGLLGNFSVSPLGKGGKGKGEGRRQCKWLVKRLRSVLERRAGGA